MFKIVKFDLKFKNYKLQFSVVTITINNQIKVDHMSSVVVLGMAWDIFLAMQWW